MIAISDYGAINAKVNAMRSRLLKSGDYERLALFENVGEIGRALCEYGAYAGLLDAEVEMNRAYIERKILLSIYNEFASLYTFIGDLNIRGYLEAFFLKNEINLIKSLLRSIVDDRELRYSLPELNKAVGDKLRFDFTAMFNTRTLDEAIESLRGTIFYSQLRNTAEASEYKLFDLEMRLDVFYYLRLYKLRDKHLSGINRKLVKSLNGFEVDYTNISWIYRLKRFYQMSEGQIYAYLIPLEHRLTKGQIVRMVEARTVPELVDEIHATEYGRYFSTPDAFDRNFYVRKNAMLSKLRLLHQDSIANVLTFLFNKEMEIKNIVSLIEGVRYRLSPGEITGYIIAPSEKEVVV